MSFELFKETFLYGNLELVYDSISISEIDYSLSYSILNDLEDIHQGCIWRFFINMKYIMYCNQYVLSYDIDKAKILLKFFLICIKKYEKLFDIENYKITDSDSDTNLFKCIILIIIKEIENNYIKLSDNQIKSYFINNFKKIKNNDNIIINYNIPYDNSEWNPSWVVCINDTQFIINDIDVYIDSYYKNHNIIYNINMKNNILILSKRLEFLKKNTTRYFKLINEKLYDITKHIYNIFPLNIIYKDYLKLLPFNYYKTKLMDLYDLENINKDIFLLIIIPEDLRCFILGYKIFSSSIPNYKNQKQSLDIILKLGMKKYFEKVYTNNKKIITILINNIPIGNNVEDETNDIYDLGYNNVFKYNLDDIIIYYNNGVVHLFTSVEFEQIKIKKQNPYNREYFMLLSNVIDNINNKKLMSNSLIKNHINLNLNSTLEDLYENLKKEIMNEDDKYIEQTKNKSILDLLFNVNDLNYL